MFWGAWMSTEAVSRNRRRWLVLVTVGLLLTVMINAQAQNLWGPQQPPSPAELRARIAAARALPSDPAAAIRLLSLPPVPQTLTDAQFLGNQTAIRASQFDAFALVRQPNCSLTAMDATYTLSTPGYTGQSTTPNYEQLLHSAAGLTTTADRFPGGCKDPGIGIASNNLIYVGQTSTGMRVGAVATGNQVHTIVATASGTLVGTTAQPAPPIAGSTPVALVSGDLNKDGTNDIISINEGPSGTGSSVSISVLLGNPDGSFTAGPSYALSGVYADSAVLDDFNGDGILDLIVPIGINGGSLGTIPTELVCYLGNGDGTFGTPKTLNANVSDSLTLRDPDYPVSGDFNGDGKKDLVSSSGLVFLGNGDGTVSHLANPGDPIYNLCN